MLLHRSMSEREFFKLLNEGQIRGTYDLTTEAQSSANVKDVVSFYVDDVWWVDKQHKIFAVIEIPDNQLVFGKGEYWASKEFGKTRIWTGRRGKTQYFVNEAYAKQYDITNVRMLSLPNHTEQYLATYRGYLKKYNIQEMSKDKNPLVILNRLHYSKNK